MLPEYTPRKPPYTHQRTALETGWRRKGFAYLMDMGCVDKDTEYLSPQGWVRISEYTGGEVAQFTLDGRAEFVEPLAYIKKPCDRFYHFRTERGVDQMLSPGHRILFCGRSDCATTLSTLVGKVPAGFRSKPRASTDFWREATPETLPPKAVCVPTTFNLHTGTKLDLTDEQIRVQVAFHADGSYGRTDLTQVKAWANGCIRIKKQYKKVRIRQLLLAAGIQYVERDAGFGFSRFKFKPPLFSKTYGSIWWDASEAQRLVIAEEACRWDGSYLKAGGKCYRSKHKSDADFIQYCFTSTGERAFINDCNKCYTVHVVGTGRTNNLALLRNKIEVHTPGAFMYCFSVPSTYLIFRRNDRVFVSGNTGKTRTLIDNFCLLRKAGLVDALLILAPKGVYSNWTRQDPNNPGELQNWLWEDEVEKALIYQWRSGKSNKEAGQQAALLSPGNGGVRVLAVNVEAISATDAAYELCKKFLRAHRCLIVVDESTVMQDPKSARSKRILSLRDLAPYRRILTGSPTKGSPTDLFTQFEFLEQAALGHRSYYTYRSAFCELRDIVVNGRTIKKETGTKNLAELSRLVAKHSYRCRKSECLDLPDKIYVRREVELTPEQKSLYEQMRKTAMSVLDDGTEMTTQVVVTQLMRLHQIVCGHFRGDDGSVTRIPNNRLQVLMEALESTEEQVIIWCNYRSDQGEVVRELRRVYGEDSVAEWYGDVPERVREAGELDFQAGRKRFMVASQQAGGRGRTWTAASLVIYYSNNHDLELREQSEDRAHRIGQKKAVTYIDIVAVGTVDEKIISALRSKKNVVQAILQDGPARWI